MTIQNFARYHLLEALHGGVAEADGNDKLSRHLHAKTKLRLISMSDEELWELARLTATPPEKPPELAYRNFKQTIEKLRATKNEWVTDLQPARPPSEEKALKKIIIIEPDPLLNRKLLATLSEAGFSAIPLTFSFDTLLEIDDIDPHMFILDESLPGRDGIEVCFQIRNIFDVPIILLGKDITERHWARAAAAGVDFCLRVPFSDQVLVARVNAILRRYKVPAR
ncbi:MAG: response regulator [Candidatus Omnitrophica bacterium]|jgi:CheY-like chemotaxis protein|nr:response regulator [Candidatus Omnitrophota bacterium]